MSAPVILAPGVVVHPRLDKGAADRVVELPGRRFARIGDDVGRLLDLAAAEPLAPAELADRLGAPWTAAIVAETQRRLDALGITGAGTAAKRARRLEYRRPLSLQLTLMNPERVLGWVRPGSRLLTGPLGALLALALAMAGLPIVIAALRPGAEALHSPAAVGTYTLTLLALLATVGLHELAHAAVLAAHGGRPRRFGVMLFYLLPAFFCDVSDAWRLAPRARVRVALAGIALQTALAGVAAVASLAASGDVQQGLLLYALLGYVYGLTNLFPFLKLDGYVALAGATDISHLRRRSMADLHSWIAHVLFGARERRELPEVAWALWFGAGCTLAPLLVLGLAVATLGPNLLALGAAGAILTLAVAALALSIAARALAGFLGDAREAGAPRARTFAVTLLAALGVAAALAFVPVPRTLHGGFAVIDGRPVGVLPTGVAARLPHGAHAEIRRAGLLAGAVVASADVAGAPEPCAAPVAAVTPLRLAGTVRARCVALDLDRPAPSIGRLGVRLPDRPLGARLGELFLLPSLQALGISN